MTYDMTMIFQWYSNDMPMICQWYANEMPMISYANDMTVVWQWYDNWNIEYFYGHEGKKILIPSLGHD